MKRAIVKYRNSSLGRFLIRNEKYAPIFFFIGGFIFDSLTLGRIDRLYDLSVLCSHMTLLTITLYFFNRVPDGIFQETRLAKLAPYFPLAIQFFFGALSSAYVVYFSRSVSLSKTAYFFVVLVLLLFANEFLKRRISNKYLQFGIYSFLSLTFFASMVPIFLRKMNAEIFLTPGTISFIITLVLLFAVYGSSVSTRKEIHFGKLIGLVILVYCALNACYFLKLIPPVPMALDEGIVAHEITRENDKFEVSYEADEWYIFWRTHNSQFHLIPGEKIFVFSSIFAPTAIKKKIFHRWSWFNESRGEWEFVEDIGYEILGGRDGGYRGYTYKSNVKSGDWRVEVLTEEELVLGVIDFEILVTSSDKELPLKSKQF